ncbi:MAG TPA: glycine dehydrogenase (aminomethyl-transferring), partial [Rhizobiales bacterium]|nr:glycine dehydrogenase (aminomethyl-transferring) [Hyphomicrobiales bacterium]
MSKNRPSLVELEPGANFIPRHIGPRESEIDEMLGTLGAPSLDDLIDRIVPQKIRVKEPIATPPAKSEREALSYLRKMADRNEVFTCMIGTGYYGTVTPKVILRKVL